MGRLAYATSSGPSLKSEPSLRWKKFIHKQKRNCVSMCYRQVVKSFWFSKTGLTLSSRTESHNTSEAITPTTPTSSSQNRLGGAPSLNTISGLASGPGMEHVKSGGLVGMLGPQPKAPRGRKKIKAENNTGPLLVVPYPLLASGPDQAVTIAKEGKTYRFNIFSNEWYHLWPVLHNLISVTNYSIFVFHTGVKCVPSLS